MGGQIAHPTVRGEHSENLMPDNQDVSPVPPEGPEQPHTAANGDGGSPAPTPAAESPAAESPTAEDATRREVPSAR